MKNLVNKIAAGISVLPVLLLPATTYAQLSKAAEALGQAKPASGPTDLPKLIGNLINVVLSVMGIVFVILIVYAGILYMQAGSDPKNAEKAKSLIINSIIGLIIIVAAYAIASFIITQITTAAG